MLDWFEVLTATLSGELYLASSFRYLICLILVCWDGASLSNGHISFLVLRKCQLHAVFIQLILSLLLSQVSYQNNGDSVKETLNILVHFICNFSVKFCFSTFSNNLIEINRRVPEENKKKNYKNYKKCKVLLISFK